MAGRDGFQPCTIDESMGPVVARWEKSIVTFALLVHLTDVGSDILVLLLFFTCTKWGFLIGSAGVVFGAWIVSGLYVSFGSSGAAGPMAENGSHRIRRFVLNFTQVQIFAEAYRCVFQGGETDYFHTLRLLEALLEAAPNAFLQLYALVHWAGDSSLPDFAVPLLRSSVLASLCSVGLGLAMWEQKVQFRASCSYIIVVAALRWLEVASRTLTLALFATVTHPYGWIWVLAIDYGVMVLIVARHRSVHLTYGFFVAIPLVLVSLEPFVWRRQDHAVPKDSYYAVRVVEGVLMWAMILRWLPAEDAEAETFSIWLMCEVLALISTLCMYCLLPFVWRAARRQELSRDVDDWLEDDRGDDFSGSDDSYLSGNEEEGGLVSTVDAHDNLPPE